MCSAGPSSFRSRAAILAPGALDVGIVVGIQLRGAMQVLQRYHPLTSARVGWGAETSGRGSGQSETPRSFDLHCAWVTLPLPI